jgi:hypothetical protein
MKKYLAVFGMLALSAPVAAQTTNCTTYASTTRCTSDGENSIEKFTEDMQREQRDNHAKNMRMAEAATERQSRAYEQVGELIAKGDCVGANRLANFYGRKDIIKSTARACPPAGP